MQPAEGLPGVPVRPRGAGAAPPRAPRGPCGSLDNRRYILGGLGLLGVLAFYLTVWRAVGRDPPKGTIISLFHPPKGVSPALAGDLLKLGRSDGWRELTAAAISPADEGPLPRFPIHNSAHNTPYQHADSGFCLEKQITLYQPYMLNQSS